MLKRNDGNYCGVKAPPFNYTNRLVVGVKKYNTLLNEEIARVKRLRREWGPIVHGYAERYPAPQYNYVDYVRNKANKKYCCYDKKKVVIRREILSLLL